MHTCAHAYVCLSCCHCMLSFCHCMLSLFCHLSFCQLGMCLSLHFVMQASQSQRWRCSRQAGIAKVNPQFNCWQLNHSISRPYRHHHQQEGAYVFGIIQACDTISLGIGIGDHKATECSACWPLLAEHACNGW